MDISSIIGYNASTQNAAKNKSQQEAGGMSFADSLGSLTESVKTKKSAADEFLDYMSMSPAERMQYAWLEQHGISKEEFSAMSAEQKEELMAQMKRELIEQMKAKEQARSMGAESVDMLI